MKCSAGPLLLWTVAGSPALRVSALRASGAKPGATALDCSGLNVPAQSALVTQTGVISCQTLPLVGSSREAGFLTPASHFSPGKWEQVQVQGSLAARCSQRGEEAGSKQLCEASPGAPASLSAVAGGQTQPAGQTSSPPRGRSAPH